MFLVLAALAFAGLTAAVDINLNVDPNVPNYRLSPKNFQKSSSTKWNLRTSIGSKLIISCHVEDQSCVGLQMLATYGKEKSYLCSEWFDQVTVIDENTATLLIVTDGTPLEPHCNVSATPSYMNVKDVSVESDEEGKEIMTKKPTCRCGWANKEDGRIVGGKRALTNEYPFLVAVAHEAGLRPDCGGSIVTEYHVITAAHCITPFPDAKFVVTVGEHILHEKNDATVVHEVAKTIVHNKYDEYMANSYYDIALLYLKKKITFTNKVGPVCMPQIRRNLEGQYIKAMGWGKTSYENKDGSDYLMKANLRVVDLRICKLIYPLNIEGDTQICTYHQRKDTCRGDSGGPLVWLNPSTNLFTQYALVSFGRFCNTTNPAVNTDVSFFMPWIETQIKATKKVSMCY